MFNMGRNPEEQFMVDQEQRQMNFQRQQQGMQSGTFDDQTALAMQEEKHDLIRWQQDMSQDLISLIMKLKRYVKDENGVWGPKMIMKEGKLIRVPPMCNDLFIEEVVEPQCEPYLSKGNTNTNLDIKMILQNLKFTFNDIASTMVNNYERYEIFEQQQQDNIIRILKNTLIPAAHRPINGWSRKMDGTIFRSIEQTSTNPDMKKGNKGIMKLFA